MRWLRSVTVFGTANRHPCETSEAPHARENPGPCYAFWVIGTSRTAGFVWSGNDAERGAYQLQPQGRETVCFAYVATATDSIPPEIPMRGRPDLHPRPMYIRAERGFVCRRSGLFAAHGRLSPRSARVPAKSRTASAKALGRSRMTKWPASWKRLTVSPGT